MISVVRMIRKFVMGYGGDRFHNDSDGKGEMVMMVKMFHVVVNDNNKDNIVDKVHKDNEKQYQSLCYC